LLLVLSLLFVDPQGQRDFTVSSMHGDMTGQERELIMKVRSLHTQTAANMRWLCVIRHGAEQKWAVYDECAKGGR